MSFKWILYGSLFVLIVVVLYLLSQFRVFTLSQQQVARLWPQGAVSCRQLVNCQLRAGDILIRRHATQRTRLFQALFKPYFTHAAFYYGDGQLVEAVGTESNRANDIQVDNFFSSDWSTDSLEAWVVIRPEIEPKTIQLIRNNLKTIADDPSYTFGLGDKKTSCAEIIFDQFVINRIIIRDKYMPRVITPDFLFQYALQRPGLFTVIGYNFN
jgi:hypothetical protein